jgi:hypothetical protein
VGISPGSQGWLSLLFGFQDHGQDYWYKIVKVKDLD